MKKSILNLGKELTKNQQHEIKGGDPFTYCWGAGGEGHVTYDTDTGTFWLDEAGGGFRRLSPQEVSDICD